MVIKSNWLSAAFGREETVTIVLPDQMMSLPGRLPVLYLFGAPGTDSDWWLRRSFLESDIHQEGLTCAAVGIRSDPGVSAEAVLEELKTLLPAMYPVSRDRTYVLAWEDDSTDLSPEDRLTGMLRIIAAEGEEKK